MVNNMTAIDIVNSTLLRNKRLKGFEQISDFGVDVLANMMKEYARIKCLEAIKNVSHKAVDILIEEYQQASVNYIANQIHNIPNQDVMPEL